MGWVACAGAESERDVRLAARSMGAEEGLSFINDADELRLSVQRGLRGEGVLIGEPGNGASAVNLAAAMVADGGFSSVVLVKRGASGSLRSRAARAGVDLVIDPAEVDVGPPGLQSLGGVFGAEGPTFVSASPAAVRAAPTPPPVESRAPIVAFASGRGGVGKTALAACACCAAASWGMSVCAVDLDLSCGDLCTCFGSPGGLDLSRVEGGGGLARAVAGAPEVAEGVRLVGPCGKPELSELAMPLSGEALRAASECSDLVVVDTSTTFTDAVAQAAQAADRLLIVGRGGSSAASMARTSGLAVRLGVARTRIARVENFAGGKQRRGPDPLGAEVGLEAARSFSVADSGAEMSELLGLGRADGLGELGLSAYEDVESMVALVLEELGCLPDRDEARRAAERGRAPKRRQWFGKRKEARSA